jgi:hypothetical protein
LQLAWKVLIESLARCFALNASHHTLARVSSILTLLPIIPSIQKLILIAYLYAFL